MGKIIGRLASVGIGKESTRGTSVSPTYWVPVTDLEIEDRAEKIYNDSGIGRIEEKNDAAVVKQWAEGSYAGKVYDRSSGVELTAVFGASPSSAQRTSTGVYDHTYQVANNNTHSSLTIGYKETNDDLRFTMAMVKSYAFEAVRDNFVRRTIEFVSKQQASASNTVSYLDENEFTPKHVTAKIATNLAGLDAASAIEITAVNIEINKNAEPAWIMGTNDPDDINNKSFTVTGSIEFYYEDQTIRDYALAATPKALRIDVVSDTIIGTSGTHTPAIRFDIARAVFTENSRSMDNNDVIRNTISFEAVYSIADTSLITARLTNAVASF